MYRRTLLALIAIAAAPLAGAQSVEDFLKASMVEKISRFIEWPGAPPARFALCISADHPLLGAVRKYYESVSIAERPVEVQVLRRADSVAGCHAAFLTAREAAEVAKLRPSAERDHVLLIAEGPQAARLGVHFGFYAELNRLKLEVNRKSLEACGLRAGFQLLEIAKVVD